MGESEVVRRTGGQLSDVYEVRPAGGPPVIVKRYADEWRWKQAKEVHVYRLIVRHGVGRPMSEVPLTPAATRAAYRRIGELQAAMHRIGQPAFGYLTTSIVDPEPDNTAYMRRQFAKKLAEFAALGGPASLHAAVRSRVAARAGLFGSCTGAVLCHNDLHEGNGPLPADGRERIELYRLYHALELWDWFASIGNTGPLLGIAEDIRRLAGGG